MTPTMIRNGIFDPDEFDEEIEHTTDNNTSDKENRNWLENQKV